MAAASVIGRGTVVRGNVRGDGNLEIHGRVEGDVTVDGDIVVAEEAAVRGNVSGAQVSVAGAVLGDLHGRDAVLVERGGRVVGDLTAPRIGVAPGALVRGNVRTDGEAPLVQAQRRAGVVQTLRGTPPVSTVKVALAPGKAPQAAPPLTLALAATVERDEEPEPPKREKAEAPPPVVPALGKHAKAKKKRREG